jgi:thiamine kinase-like enzyme
MVRVGPDRELREQLVAALQRVPELVGRQLRLTALSGGITNRNYRIDVEGSTTGGAFVLRLAGNDTHLLGISREVEHAATVTAAGVGVAPEVVAYLRPEGYLLTRFIEGSPISDAAVHEPATIRRVADSLRRVHDGPAIPGIFMPYRIGEAYHALAAAYGVPIPSDYLAAHEAARLVEIALLQQPVAMRPCHNDLLNANFIDDGSRVRIVDWEYAGMGDPWFDLGNFSVNHGLTQDEEALLVEAYAGTVQPGRLARLRLMRVLSDFREGMWGVLQQAISTLEVDFAAYAEEHLARLLATVAEPGHDEALRSLGSP